MISTLTVVHVIVCVLLIVLVLLQFGKGAETGLLDAASGGTNFGPKGNLLSKTTVVLSILFLGLCITLAKLRSKQVQESIFDDQAAKAKPLNMNPGGTLQENKETQPAPINGDVENKAMEVKEKTETIMKKATDAMKEKAGAAKEAASEGAKAAGDKAKQAVQNAAEEVK